MTALFSLSGPTVQASEENMRPLPRLSSIYQDDESCSEHVAGPHRSERWIDAYRDAFALAVGDALEWAVAKTGVCASRDAE